jgi:hypothetical protein
MKMHSVAVFELFCFFVFEKANVQGKYDYLLQNCEIILNNNEQIVYKTFVKNGRRINNKNMLNLDPRIAKVLIFTH